MSQELIKAIVGGLVLKDSIIGLRCILSTGEYVDIDRDVLDVNNIILPVGLAKQKLIEYGDKLVTKDELANNRIIRDASSDNLVLEGVKHYLQDSLNSGATPRLKIVDPNPEEPIKTANGVTILGFRSAVGAKLDTDYTAKVQEVPITDKLTKLIFLEDDLKSGIIKGSEIFVGRHNYSLH